MKRLKIYDIPTRLFHWLFAALFVTAFSIAKTVDDESPAFSYHMLLGLLLASTVLLRIFWGFVGTKYARFSSFSLHPKDFLAYFSGIASGNPKKWAGHNPASSWASLFMLLLALGLGATGYLMASGHRETFEDVHELLANGFLVVVLLHVAGVFLHSIRHRDGIAFSMINGAKNDLPPVETISNPKPIVGVLFLAFLVAFAAHLIGNFDPQKQTLALFGKTLHLGESEENEQAENGAANGEGETLEMEDDDRD